MATICFPSGRKAILPHGALSGIERMLSLMPGVEWLADDCSRVENEATVDVQAVPPLEYTIKYEEEEDPRPLLKRVPLIEEDEEVRSKRRKLDALPTSNAPATVTKKGKGKLGSASTSVESKSIPQKVLTKICHPEVVKQLLEGQQAFADLTKLSSEREVEGGYANDFCGSLSMITTVEKEKSDVQLAQILSRILLALRYAREKPDLEEVAKKRGIMVELMKKWIRAGQNYARLACAGSVYLLLMIAHVDGLHTTITRMSIDNMKNLLQILMHPSPDTDEGRYVVETVIPTISELRRKYPTTMASIFSDPGIPPVSCPDLQSSEAFFRSFLPDLAYLRPRNPIAWRECLSFVEHVPSGDRTLVLDTVTQEARKETDA